MKYLFLVFFVLQSLYTFSQVPPMVWTHKDGGERNEYVYFRKAVKLCDVPTKAVINLYADSRYALYVNEVYVGFGPARTFHKNPTYDTYDIAAYLKKGNNTIAVKALSNGMVTYQLFDYKGGFTAWGEIMHCDKPIDLAITKGWVCKKSTSYDQTAARFSFATGAIENIDTRKDIGWNSSSISVTAWQTPVILTDQKRWGKLTPRIIPHLTQQEVVVNELLGIYALEATQDIYSFRIPTTDKTPQKYNENHTTIAYTYLYSPADKSVTAGMWWGDYYLNGARVYEEKEQSRGAYRKDYIFNLHKGWNLFVSRHGVIWGSWDYNLALPNDEALVLSTTKNKDSEAIFESYGPFVDLKDNAPLDKVDLTKTVDEIKINLMLSQPAKKWQSQLRGQTSNHPARDLAWNSINFTSPLEIKNDLSNVINIPIQEKGAALIYDMGEMQLGRIFIEGNFKNGTIIDIGFSEELNAKGTPWLYKRYQIGAGHRFITSKIQTRYETFKPYGARYLQVNVMNENAMASIQKVGMMRQVYPFETVGSFNCSDPLLNKIWEAGWRTLQLCAEDSYTDTPFRERGLYAGDMLPEAAITMAVSGDTRLLEHSLNIFQDMYHKEMYEAKENVHADFPLVTLVTMDYYLQYTGDWDFVERHYENYNLLLRSYAKKKTKDGLFHADQVFIEWTALNKHDAAMTAHQALAVESMNILHKWATKLGKPKDAAFFASETKMLKKAINKTLWDEDSHLFWDGMKSDSLIRVHHLTSSVWASLFNTLGKERKAQVLTEIKKEMQDVIVGDRQNKIAPYSSFYLFALLYQSGEPGLAEAFMKKHWGPMAMHAGTTWENFNINGSQGTSSHAWSGHPTYFLSSEVLGVNLGFYKELNRDVIEIAPQSATLSWAEGAVAHPLGKVEVAWKIVGNRLLFTYDVPEGATVVVKPKGRLGALELWVNGVRI